MEFARYLFYAWSVLVLVKNKNKNIYGLNQVNAIIPRRGCVNVREQNKKKKQVTLVNLREVYEF